VSVLRFCSSPLFLVTPFIGLGIRDSSLSFPSCVLVFFGTLLCQENSFCCFSDTFVVLSMVSFGCRLIVFCFFFCSSRTIALLTVLVLTFTYRMASYHPQARCILRAVIYLAISHSPALIFCDLLYPALCFCSSRLFGPVPAVLETKIV